MKRILILFCTLIATKVAMAQTIPGGDMETWRTHSAGLGAPVFVNAPTGWYGVDSLIIGLGQTFGTFLMAPDSVWHKNLFQESTIVHSGTKSAKVMTLLQDTLLLPGVLTTAQTHIGIVFFPTPGITGISFTGGTPVTTKPQTVSAWVQYFPGKDSSGATGIDSGVLNVQALSRFGTKDSVVGTGTVIIAPSSSWVLVTATVNYPVDSARPIDTMRITFTSSKGAGLDSSTLYVDDVTMTSTTNPPDRTAVSEISANTLVAVYPNPATGKLYLTNTTANTVKVNLYSITGQQVATKEISGTEAIDVSTLASGMYNYVVFDQTGAAVQQGKVTINN